METLASPVDIYQPEEPRAVRKRHGAVKPTLVKFTDWTSTHGLQHIAKGRGCCAITFWTVIVLVSFVLLLINVGTLVRQYLLFNVAVGVELRFVQLAFPAVTICDLNPYKKSIVQDMAESNRLLLTYRYALGKIGCSDTSCPHNPLLEDYLRVYGFEDVHDTAALQSKAQSLLAMAMARERDATQKRNAMAFRKSFIKSCSFNTKDCDFDHDFEDTEDPKLGMCFTFKVSKERTSQRAGPIYGLRMILKTNVDEYLATTEAAGFRVVIHNQTEHPFPDILGLNADVGTATSIGVTYREIKRLGAPYGDCLINKPDTYLYNGTYNIEGCQRGCFQNQIESNCGCTDPAYATNKDLPTCDASNKPQRECWQEASNGKMAAEQCVCPQPCNEGIYDVTVSTARWPSISLRKVVDCVEGDHPEETCRQHFSRNGAYLEIFYSKLNYELFDETPAYELVNLASDFGGQIGLWLGLSAVSVAEFVILAGFLIRNYCCPTGESPQFVNRKKSPQRPPATPASWYVPDNTIVGYWEAIGHEFPTLNPYCIRAVSIARRLHDAMSELVKRHPKHLAQTPAITTTTPWMRPRCIPTNYYPLALRKVIRSKGRKGIILMLMRNISPRKGLCNGTRLILEKAHTLWLRCTIATGDHAGEEVFIPRVELSSNENEYTFKWRRRQFPVRPAFGITINKSQGQTLRTAGIWLQEPVFSHGQLYVAASRVGDPKQLHIAIPESNNGRTRNVVYKEALL